MDDRDAVSAKLTTGLRAIDFDRRYYGFYDQIRNHLTASHLKKPDWESALSEAGLSFRYDSNERFFFSEKNKVVRCDVALHVRFRHDEAEFILNLLTPRGDRVDHLPGSPMMRA